MLKKTLVILAHAWVGWALCAAVMVLGMRFFSLSTALIIHAVAAPAIFGFVSWVYFRKFAYTKSLQTAGIFTLVIMATDLFLVAMLIQKSFAMFESLIGSWIPFGLIFLSTYLTGIIFYTRRITQKRNVAD